MAKATTVNEEVNRILITKWPGNSPNLRKKACHPYQFDKNGKL